MNRPTFYIGKHPIRACGVTFYSFHEGQMLLLLMKTSKWYEDIGGKTECNDKNIYFTCAREVNEETNGVIEFDEIYQSLQHAKLSISRKSKYVSFYVEIPWFENTEIFGDYELHEINKRSFQWIDAKDINTIKRNYRLDKNWEKVIKKLLKNYKWDFPINL